MNKSTVKNISRKLLCGEILHGRMIAGNSISEIRMWWGNIRYLVPPARLQSGAKCCPALPFGFSRWVLLHKTLAAPSQKQGLKCNCASLPTYQHLLGGYFLLHFFAKVIFKLTFLSLSRRSPFLSLSMVSTPPTKDSWIGLSNFRLAFYRYVFFSSMFITYNTSGLSSRRAWFLFFSLKSVKPKTHISRFSLLAAELKFPRLKSKRHAVLRNQQ